jgi:hypothetical protein
VFVHATSLKLPARVSQQRCCTCRTRA